MENCSNSLKPTYCCIALLESCFMRCKMCYKWQEDVSVRHLDEPSFAQWMQCIKDLAVLCAENKPQMNFAGGEPLAMEETLELIRHAEDLGFDALLATNAYLIDTIKAKEIAEAHLSNISISLDGVNARTHDFMRGVEGSFLRVMKALDMLSVYTPQTKIYLNSVITDINMKEIVDLVRWAEADGRIHGLGFQAVTQPFSTPEQDDWYVDEKYAFLWPKDQRLMAEVMDEMTALKETGNFRQPFKISNPAGQFKVYKRYFNDPAQFVKKIRCHLDTQAINITPAGAVHICFYKPPIGNIKQQSILQMWDSDEAVSVREQIRQCRKNCQSMVNCNFKDEEDYVV
ncbi:MAG: radical SAM protein [Candidatus Omnitrophica bacterium]|nr:radical SAM protein [Candidatus Omnitrophota bacterium]MBU4477879.1 radical SAM protein [Candidatus Omnitrophota bacterium]MCG2703734.1 radical SAM protein [Candidatus Omnitrophota bacterium]